MLKTAIAYKHDNILEPAQLKELSHRVLPLEDSSALNLFIIDSYAYSSPDTQFSTMTDMLTATIEELQIRGNSTTYWWNVAETRSLTDFSLTHVFNKIVNILHSEGYISAERYAKGVITEARLSKSKQLIIYRLDGS